MNLKLTLLGAAIAATVGSPAALAVDLSQISINGFGSVVGGMTLDEDQTYFGNDDNFSFQPESRFALQVAAPISEKWSATAQILARGENNFDPNFEWAYIGYQATEDLKILLGRQRFKLYKYSDYVDVGYAYPWLRTPQGVYAIPFSSGDGVSAVYTTYSGDLEMTFTGAAQGINIPDYEITGSTELEPTELNIELSYFTSADFVMNAFNFGFNVAYVPEFSLDIQTANPALGNLLGLLAGSGVSQDTIDSIEVNKDSALLYGIYFGYDPGPFFLLTEYTKIDYDPSILADTESMYVTLGARHNLWTFHVTYGIDENEVNSGAPSQVPAPFAPSVTGAVSTQLEDSTTTSVGVRYDIETGIALKADFTNYQNTKETAPDANVIAVGVDFVF
jgi:hypothetical protein